MNQMTEITNQHSANVKVQAPKNVAIYSFCPSKKPKGHVAHGVDLSDLKDYVKLWLRDYCDGFSLGFNFLPQKASLDDYLHSDEDALMGDWAAIGEDMQTAILKTVEENLKGS